MRFSGLVILSIISLSQIVLAAEGFFNPFEFPYPQSFPKEKALYSVLRVRGKIVMNLNILENEVELNEWNGQPVTYNHDGSAVVPVGYLRKDVSKCSDPDFKLLPYNFDFCTFAEKGFSFPRRAPFNDRATAFFVSKDGYIVTNFHVAHLCIKQLKRQNGSVGEEPLPCGTLSLEVADSIDSNGTVNYVLLPNLYLVANVSEREANVESPGQQGPFSRADLALLKTTYRPKGWLKLNPISPNKLDSIFMLGHPIRSQRSELARTTVGYQDADNTLRVSFGNFLKFVQPETFVTNLDGGPGNSGSPVMDVNGEALGVLADAVGLPNNFTMYGGFYPNIVSSKQVCEKFRVRQLYPSIEGCN